MTPIRRTSTVLVMGLLIGAVGGAALGVLWWRLAPRVSVVVRPDTVFPATYQPDGYIAADVAFAALALVAGIAVTIGLIRMRREHLIATLFASLLAGVVGSGLMWLVGTRLGHVDIEGLSATITDKITVDAPLQLTMPALLLLWPIVAALVVMIVALVEWLGDVRRSEQ